MRTVEAWRAFLQATVRDAMKARDTALLALARETRSAIDQAEAVPPPPQPSAEGGPIAGAVEGLGTTEVARRALSPEEVAAVVRREREERVAAAATLRAHGQPLEAARLDAQAALLTAWLT